MPHRAGDMALQEKIDYFAQLSAVRGGGGDDDEFQEKEVETRRHSRRFFSRSRTTTSLEAVRRVDSFDDAVLEKSRNGTKRRQQQQSSGIIESTPSEMPPGKATRLQRRLDNQDAPVVKETPLRGASAVKSGNSVKACTEADATPFPKPTTDKPFPGGKKRKRTGTPSGPPSSDNLLFKECCFFYVPNNSIATARKIRINKAQDHGAKWVRDVESATHVVVEKNIHYKDVESIIKKTKHGTIRGSADTLPVVVNENYPLDCIQFRVLLDPDQKKYRLAGQVHSRKQSEPSVPAETALPPAPAESAASLPLKQPERNARRWDYVPIPGTPLRSEESSQRSAKAGSAREAAPVSDGQEAAQTGEQMATSAAPASAVPQTHRDVAKPVCQPVNDDLSDYIDIMQKYKDLPIETEEAENADSGEDSPPGSDDEQTGSHSRLQKHHPKLSHGQKKMRFEERFACHSAGIQGAGTDNPNARTIEVLQQMLHYYERISDEWRVQGYRKAIATLKRQKTRIETEAEAFRLPTIGRRIAQKIEEIVTTDSLQRLHYAQNEGTDETLQLFLGIYEVGVTRAQQWIAQGFRTLDDLKEKANLTTNQRIGVEHYKDLNTRIPRAQVEALGAVVTKAAAMIDPAVTLVIGGSYRRGSESSNDIDMIVTKAGTQSTSKLVPFLNELVAALEAQHFLVARLASSRTATDGSKWHGCCVLPATAGCGGQSSTEVGRDGDAGVASIWRRIDFLLVPETEMGAALIYFTGNDIFNRSMRLLAARKGMRLNQRGLYRDLLKGPEARNKVKCTADDLIEGRDERRIFEVLGVKWREPHERWC